jgi:hypothetical protein
LIIPILQCGGQTSNLKIIVKDTNPSNWDSASNEVVIGITGFLRHDEDGHWRYYLTINITNNGGVNITLFNIRTEILNVTYVDESFEEWDITGNLTLNQVVGSHSSVLYDWKISEFGFVKEPKIVWAKLDAFILGLENPLTLTFVIPEFPSFLFLSLFIIATLLGVIVYRKKHAKISGSP